MALRFGTGRPVSAITPHFLEWVWSRLQAQGKTWWLLLWDQACWPYSQLVRTWIREHNSQVKQESKGVRILPFFLPPQSRLSQSDRAQMGSGQDGCCGT